MPLATSQPRRVRIALLYVLLAPVAVAQVNRVSTGSCETTRAQLHLCTDTTNDFDCFTTGAVTQSFSTFASVETAGEGFGMASFNDSNTALWQDMNATIADAADGSTAIQGCGPPNNSTSYAGRLLFVERGNCSFFDKLAFGVAGGARAVVFFDTTTSPSALNSNFRLPTGAAVPSTSSQQAVSAVPVFGISFRTWSIIHPSAASATAGQSFDGSASPGPRFFTFKCPAAVDLGNETTRTNLWTQLASSSAFDHYDPFFFNVTSCPDAIVANYDCIQTEGGCTAGYYCPYGNIPIEQASPETYDAVKCNESAPDYDETNCCLTNVSTGIVECKCPPGFYCPVNTSQPLYCFEGFECEEPAKIQRCPSGHFCPYATVKAFNCLGFDLCPEGSSMPNRWLLILVVFLLFVALYWVFLLRNSYLRVAEAKSMRHLDDFMHDREMRREVKWDDVQTRYTAGIINASVFEEYNKARSRQTAAHLEVQNQVRVKKGRMMARSEHDHHSQRNVDYVMVDTDGKRLGVLNDKPKGRKSWRSHTLTKVVPPPGAVYEETAVEAGSVPVKIAVYDEPTSPVTPLSPAGVPIPIVQRSDSGALVVAPMYDSTSEKDALGDGAALLHSSDHGYDIEFEKVCMQIPSGKTVLESVSGEFLSGKLTAVMGPSGSGKTTLLNLVAGKHGMTQGDMFVNGHKVCGLGKWKREVAFVPQDDIMHTDLTVRENILFHARLRLPKRWNEDEIQRHVCWVMEKLQIEHLQNAVVGDTAKRGISGGQRKRVNIGMELASFPSILFLDEPTSGLDSTTATDLIRTLHRLAEPYHLTIAAVIHAPTSAAFSLFDRLLLLQKGGRSAYYGKPMDAGELFVRLGYSPKLPVEAEADYLLDIASGTVFREQTKRELDRVNGEDVTAADVFEAYLAWRKKGGDLEVFHHRYCEDFDAVEHGVRAHEHHLGIVGVASHYQHVLSAATYSVYLTLRLWLHNVCDSIKDEFNSLFPRMTRAESDVAPRHTASVFVQTLLCARRAWSQRVSQPGAFVLKLFRHFLQGLALSISLSYTEGYVGPFPYIFCRYGAAPALFLQCTQPYVETVAVSGMLLSFSITFIAATEGISTFLNEKVVYWRECRSGLTTFAYYFGKAAVDVIVLWLSASMFTAGYALNFANTGNWGEFYAIIIMMYLFGWVQGYLVVTLTRKDLATLTAVSVAVLWCILLGGFQPSLRQVRSEYQGFEWLWDLSGPRWNLEAFFINQMEYYRVSPHNSSLPYINQTTTFDRYDFDRDSMGSAFTNALLITMGWFAIAGFMMTLANRTKKR